jgi:endogenous inhibitor of DNA gyrase (YacG/DUF329 family)
LANSPQRAYRAACPNCGAPVEFASAASASAVCSYCKSTLLRDGETLKRIGVVGDLFDDHSPLRRGASGRLQGQPFTLVGRLQYAYEGGTWNEWHALFDNGRSGWLSEDNGAYVFAFDTTLAAAPPLDGLRAGQRVQVAGQSWDVASVVRARLLSAEGELPTPPPLQGEFTVVDLRNALGEVGTLDDAHTPPAWAIGRTVALSELALAGLAEGSEKTLKGRSVECPSCGTTLEVKLSTTQSLACTQCRAVVDLSGGVGAELKHFGQNNSGPGGLEPQIPLGKSGTLALGGAPLPWQVVGFMERSTEADGETFHWREYLLWHRTAGFVFLVDSEDGWSWVKPITGAPEAKGDGARWQGASYRLKERYSARVGWVQGEFYWRVRRDERALVADYVGVGLAAKNRLSREQTADEVVWSAGETLAASQVAQAFGLAAPALARDAGPVSAAKGVPTAVFLIGLILIVVLLSSRCSRDDCDEVRATFGPASAEYQQCVRNRGSGGRSGSSSGGWSSSGGGHK